MDDNAGYVYAGYLITAVAVAAYALRLAFGLRHATRREGGGSGEMSGGSGEMSGGPATPSRPSGSVVADGEGG